MQRSLVILITALVVVFCVACQRDTNVEALPFKMAQRSTVDVPGFSGQVKIWVGDIQRGTRAETVRIHTSTDEILYESAGVEEGTNMRFSYGDKQHTVVIKRFENHTFSTDYAHLEAQVDNGFIPVPVQKIESAPPPPMEGGIESQTSAKKVQADNSAEAREYKPQRKTSVCGTAQPTIQARVADCAGKNPSLVKIGPSDGGKHYWQLVTRTAPGREVWFNSRTNKVWSDRLGSELLDMASWCRAAGRNDTSTTRLMNCAPKEETHGRFDIFIAQSDPAESWCEEQENFITPTRFDDAKGHLDKKSNPSVHWRLPSEDDWEAAKEDQATDVLPNFNRMISWSTSLLDYHATNLMEKYMSARGGGPNDIPAFPIKQVRCIGELLSEK